MNNSPEQAPRPVRVLWLAKGLGRGGAERLIVESARHLDRERFVVEVAYVLPWKDAFVGDLESQGIPVHCLGRGRTLDPRWVWRLRRLVRERSFDLVHTHMPVPAVAARLALPRRPPVIVHTEHNLWTRYRSVTRWTNALTYPRNSAVIAVSAAVAASIDPPRWGPASPPVEVVLHGPHIESIPHGPDARRRARELLSLDPDDRVIGTVGNFTAKKNQRMLLDAVAQLAAPGRVRVVLVGIGPLRDALETHARALGLGDRATFTGLRSDVYDLLPAFDVFALSSDFEGLPIALLEAMAAGVPCVATAVGGIPEVVTDGEEGYLVGGRDVQAFAARLQKILDDPVLAESLGANASRRAAAFDLRSAVRRTESIYDRARGIA
jgi:glycosyltransferase involved in cell wall biosynthesis